MGELLSGPTGIFGSLKRLLSTALAVAENRLELLLVELQEERVQFFELLLLAGVVISLAVMSLGLITVTLVVLCVRAERFDLLVGLMVLYLASTGVAFWRLRKRLTSWEPFSATLTELKKDKACFADKS